MPTIREMITYKHFHLFVLQMSEAEPSNMEVFISLSGIGVSLINALYEEVAFVTLTSSPAMWEVEVQ